MMRSQHHRGPDGEGCWSGQVAGFQIGLAHNRLAILDLSEAGRQPMFTPDGDHALIYNGEIYNYKELRSDLEAQGIGFRTQCDTEVLLLALATWGERAVEKFNGMWAFAWFDLRAGRLMLSRDRFGIKPLHLYRGRNSLFFASETKAILAGSAERFPINPSVAGRFVEQSLLDAQSETFFSGIEALPAGHNLVFELNGRTGLEPQSHSYWSPSTEAVKGNIAQRIDEVRETFADAVRIRLRSDVPVGVLLSGGVDSSSIAAVMRRVLGRDSDLHVMSAVSDNGRFDEKPFIDLMARHLECPVHWVRLKTEPSQWFQLVSEVTYSNDEPIGGFSSVAHYLLMKQAKELGITVILSGQGADELLCGYFKFTGFYLQQLVRQRRLAAAARLLAGFARRGTVLRQVEFSEARRYLHRFFKRADIDIRGPLLRATECRIPMGLSGGTVIDRQRADLYRFSVPALVHYEDRSSMASSREIRLPFLDYRLVNLLLPIDPEWKLRDGWTKWIFRQAMKDWLPEGIVWRKDKQGFINPESEWLKSELRPAIERFLREDLLIAQAGLVDRDALIRRYRAYCDQPPMSGRFSVKDIFNPIALELWARSFEPHLAL